MKTNHLEMIRVTLEASEKLPVDRRVRVLRGLADVCGDSRECARLKDLADSLQIADANCREFNGELCRVRKTEATVNEAKTQPATTI